MKNNSKSKINTKIIDKSYSKKKSNISNKQSEIIFPNTSNSSSFAKIGMKHVTDKITHHGYHRFYPRFIEFYRPLPADYGMLEIGIDRRESLFTWLDYFPKQFIYGIDIRIVDEGERYKIFKSDQSDISQIKKIVKNEIKHKIFFIIDDGSHIPEHQILCFNYLFKNSLIPGGTYIIEDIETSYWTQGKLYEYNTRYGYQHEKSCIEIFKSLIDDVNREFLTPNARDTQNKKLNKLISLDTRMMISSITFGQNCIIIQKKTSEEMKYNNRPYRFHKHL